LKALIFSLLTLLTPLIALAEGGVDAGVEMRRGETRVGKVEAWSSLPASLESYGYADTTKYMEVLVGKPFTVGSLEGVGYVGVEKDPLKGGGARGALWLNYKFTETFEFEGLWEFGGSGPWHRLQFHYHAEKWRMSLIRKTGAGNGVRIQRKMEGFQPYIAVYPSRKLVEAGVVKTF
jgi:hypothetical protein